MQGFGHDPPETSDIDRLQEVIVGAMLHDGDGSFCRAIGGQEDHRHIAIDSLNALQPRFKGSWPYARIFCAGRVQAYVSTGTSAMIQPLATLADGVPHGADDAAEQARGPLACGAGGRTHAQRGGPHRPLLPAAPRSSPRVWPRSGGPAPGDSRWPPCPLSGGGTPGGPWEVIPAPARPPARRAP